MRVELPSEQVAPEVERRLKDLARTVRMNGFRPGKVPVSVVRKRFGGQVRQEVYGELIRTSYGEAVEDQQLKPAGEPRIEAVDEDDRGGFAYTAVFEVMPEVQLGELTELGIRRPVVQVTDADLDAMIEKLRRQRITWEGVERPAQEGDQMTISFKGSIDGEPFAEGSGEQVPLVLGSGRMIEGFEQGLVGAAAGDTRGLDLAFPADYRVAKYAGKPVHFDVEVVEVKAGRLPDVDAEFAKVFGVENGDVDRLKADVRGNMERELRQKVRGLIKNHVMDALLRQTQVEVPNALADREAERLKEQARAEMAGMGRTSTVDLPREMFADQARRRVALGLILGELVKTHGIKVDPQRVRTMIEEMAESYEQPQEVVDWYYRNKEQLAAVENVVLEDEVVDWVMGQARVEDEPSSFDAIMGSAV